MEALNVTWDGGLVAHLAPEAGRGMSIRYAPAWLSSPQARAISLSLPHWEESFPDGADGCIGGHVLT